jgi:hypothetical protein
MHASISRFVGDPDELLRRYDAMRAEIPAAAMAAHICLRAPDGILVLDTCPSKESFDGFVAGAYPAMRARHGLPDPVSLDDYPVHAAFAGGRQIAQGARP